MFLLRLILAILFFVMARRVYLSYRAAKRIAEERRQARRAEAEQAQRRDLDDLTQQDISDADFEEIP